MRVLIFTQKVDLNDPVLGFFHSWLEKFSYHFTSIEVICLEKGNFDLPSNVNVYSLGKESGVSKLGYLKNFWKLVFIVSGSYDKVFVHMNQEYAILGGLYWKLKKIPVYLWRNHPKGNLLTYLAVFFSTKVFCTSTESFTARFKKTVIMPVGNNTDLFKPVQGIVRKKYSVCMLGRIAPVKNIMLGLEAVDILAKSGVQVSLDIIGSPIERDMKYYDSLVEYVNKNNLSTFVNFEEGAGFSKHPSIFSVYEITLNLTDSGSFDKSIVGATACGSIPVTTNKSLKGVLPDICVTENSAEGIANSIRLLLNPHEQIKIQEDLKKFADSHSLNELIKRLEIELK